MMLVNHLDGRMESAELSTIFYLLLDELFSLWFAKVGISSAFQASRFAVSIEKPACGYSRSDTSVFRCYVVVRVAEIAGSFPRCCVAQVAAR